LGGVQAGYNWQIDRFVWGIEGDIQITGERGGVTICPAVPGACGTGFVFGTANYSLPWFGTLRGRAGVAWDRVLFYATGGLAVGEIKADYTDGFVGLPSLAPFAIGSRSSTRIGWVAGGGIECAIDNNWSIKAEYLHVDLGSVNQSVTATTSVSLGTFFGSPIILTQTLNGAFRTHLTDDIVRVGVNYKFGWTPPPAVTKY
jgi:outer membrane immunogenic protein